MIHVHPRIKTFYHAWYRLRQALGLTPWYHSTALCHLHRIPRTHRISFLDERYPRGILLCGKGPRDNFTGKPIRL